MRRIDSRRLTQHMINLIDDSGCPPIIALGSESTFYRGPFENIQIAAELPERLQVATFELARNYIISAC